VKLAWSSAFDPAQLQAVAALPLASPITADWAWGGSTGAGVKVAVVDSGIEGGHPAIGDLAGAVAFEPDPDAPDGVRVSKGPHEDLYGHGTACGSIIRRIAPDVELHSVRVLGTNLRGRGYVFAAGLRWTLDHDIDVVNLSLSSAKRDYFAVFHELTDEAYFRNRVWVCAASNVSGATYPSEYASVISVAAHGGHDPLGFDYNPSPPVELGAPGIDVEVAWTGGGTRRVSGNSFAAAHITGVVSLILAKHPGLTPFQLKTILHACAGNARFM
jgi:subtilisin family serine protease